MFKEYEKAYEKLRVACSIYGITSELTCNSFTGRVEYKFTKKGRDCYVWFTARGYNHDIGVIIHHCLEEIKVRLHTIVNINEHMRQFNVDDLINVENLYPKYIMDSSKYDSEYIKRRINEIYGVGAFINNSKYDMLYTKRELKEIFGMNGGTCMIPEIDKVIFNPPATIVKWADGTKTVVKTQDERFDHEKGLAMAISKKVLGNKGNYYETFKKWIPEKDRWSTSKEIEELLSRCGGTDFDGDVINVVPIPDQPLDIKREGITLTVAEKADDKPCGDCKHVGLTGDVYPCSMCCIDDNHPHWEAED